MNGVYLTDASGPCDGLRGESVVPSWFDEDEVIGIVEVETGGPDGEIREENAEFPRVKVMDEIFALREGERALKDERVRE